MNLEKGSDIVSLSGRVDMPLSDYCKDQDVPSEQELQYSQEDDQAGCFPARA